MRFAQRRGFLHKGGNIIAEGTPNAIKSNKDSVTGKYT